MSTTPIQGSSRPSSPTPSNSMPSISPNAAAVAAAAGPAIQASIRSATPPAPIEPRRAPTPTHSGGYVNYGDSRPRSQSQIENTPPSTPRTPGGTSISHFISGSTSSSASSIRSATPPATSVGNRPPTPTTPRTPGGGYVNYADSKPRSQSQTETATPSTPRTPGGSSSASSMHSEKSNSTSKPAYSTGYVQYDGNTYYQLIKPKTTQPSTPLDLPSLEESPALGKRGLMDPPTAEELEREFKNKVSDDLFKNLSNVAATYRPPTPPTPRKRPTPINTGSSAFSSVRTKTGNTPRTSDLPPLSPSFASGSLLSLHHSRTDSQGGTLPPQSSSAIGIAPSTPTGRARTGSAQRTPPQPSPSPSSASGSLLSLHSRTDSQGGTIPSLSPSATGIAPSTPTGRARTGSTQRTPTRPPSPSSASGSLLSLHSQSNSSGRTTPPQSATSSAHSSGASSHSSSTQTSSERADSHKSSGSLLDLEMQHLLHTNASPNREDRFYDPEKLAQELASFNVSNSESSQTASSASASTSASASSTESSST